MKLNVLILDDDEGLLKTLKGMVEELGHSAHTAVSADEAFAIIGREDQIEVILADVRLPGLSGLDFLKRVSERRSGLAVVLMTAFSDVDLAVMALETGAFGFLRKPFATKELEVMLRNVVSTRRLEQQNVAMRRLLDCLEVLNASDPTDNEINLDGILRLALDTTRSSSGSILLLSGDDGSVEAVAHIGLDDVIMQALQPRLVAGITSKVMDIGRTVILDCRRIDENNPFYPLMKRPEIVSAISAPIQSKDKVLGVLNLNRTRAGDLFDESDRDLADIFANTLALAVENSRLRTEQARNWERLQKMQRQLIQTEKLSSLGQLAAGIAHEINNPLTSVMGFAELLLRKVKDEGAADFLNKIVSNSERIKRILLDLKDFYVPSKNRLGRTSINKIIENAIPIARVHPEAAGITITKSLETSLPELFCDENQILQVLINLFINAFQAMPNGGRVTVRSWQEGPDVKVSVADTGVGIPPENIDRIFDPFFTTKSDWKGTGLGLSVCYTIVDNHGGQICVESEPGKGATFTLSFPKADAPSPQRGAEGGRGLSDGRGRILVVDDEADCRELLKNVLTELGFEVDEAHDGTAAIDLYRCRSDYELIFLDYKMPGLNGAETYRRLREIDADVKVIVLTGSIGESARMIVELGAQGFITKPFKVNDIEQQLRKVLGSSW